MLSLDEFICVACVGYEGVEYSVLIRESSIDAIMYAGVLDSRDQRNVIVYVNGRSDPYSTIYNTFESFWNAAYASRPVQLTAKDELTREVAKIRSRSEDR